MAEHVAAVKDGKLDYSYTDSSKKQSQATGSNLGYDQFLTLLCAEMQYRTRWNLQVIQSMLRSLQLFHN